MTLLSPAQRAQFKAAVNSVTDTFMLKPLLYRRYGESIDRWNENRLADQKKTEYNVLGLIVWGSNESDKTVMDSEGKGGYDISDGYALFNIKDLVAVGLVNGDGNFIGKSNSDYIVDQNVEHSIIGHKLIGQLVDENLMIKLYLEKNLNHG